MELKENEKSNDTLLEELPKPVTNIGVTKKDKSPSKRKVKISKKSRKINRTKKRHKMTKKEKKSRRSK